MFEHWGNTIYWDQLTWEAFAALVTGLAVVGGATWVGLRQAEIQQRTLRLSMFERRYAIYRAVARWVGFILTAARTPNRGGNPDADELSRDRAFLDAMDESRFVFSGHVFDALEKIWQQGNALHLHQRSANIEGALDRAYHLNRERELLLWFNKQAQGMAAIFGDELKVSDGGSSNFRPLAKAADDVNA